MRERFRREARVIAKLRHPNIVQVYDFDIANDVYFMVMEFIEGETLNHRLADLRRRGERMPLSEVLRVVIAVGRALHHAHGQGMVHRDIKPGNVMFRNDDAVVLTDFGMSKILNVASDITATGTVAGTPAYMAPEQWTDDEPDQRSDIYSLGIVLYQLATGELPFTDETVGRLMFKHISEPPPLPRDLNANISEELEQVILRALAKDPEDRYQTAHELINDLGAIVYQVESTLPTGVFRRPKLPLVVADDWVGGRKSVNSSARPWLWFSAGVALVLIVLITWSVRSFVSSAVPAATPNATATALNDRLAALESTLSAALTPLATASQKRSATPSRTPLATPSQTPVEPTRTVAPTEISAPSSTPSPMPMLMPSPTVCHLAMMLEQDVNYSDVNWWNRVNVRFEKAWRVRNSGDCAWPQGSVLVHLDGQDFGFGEPVDVSALPAGEEMELVITLQTPGVPGQYEGRFQLQSPEGGPVGEPLTVRLEARPYGSPTPTLPETVAPLRIAGYDLIQWTEDLERDVWHGTVGLWAEGGTGQYTWYRDTLDSPLPGDTFTFEWGRCRDFFGSVWVVSGEMMDHEGLYIDYPGGCE
jgi:serine/threonine protein kinase